VVQICYSAPNRAFSSTASGTERGRLRRRRRRRRRRGRRRGRRKQAKRKTIIDFFIQTAQRAPGALLSPTSSF
jgi:hypothetical protein